jgi:hypothetical protein
MSFLGILHFKKHWEDSVMMSASTLETQHPANGMPQVTAFTWVATTVAHPTIQDVLSLVLEQKSGRNTTKGELTKLLKDS